MNKKTIYLILVGIVVFALSGCGKEADDAKSMEQLHSELGVPVRTSPMEKSTYRQELKYNATLSGIEESTASAMVGDVVTNIRFKVGDKVQKDDIVIKFPANTPAAQYEQAQSAFNSISAIHDRMYRLKEQGAVSQQDYDNVKTQYEVSKANLEASEQMINVRAPISGVITDIMVNVSDNVFPGAPLFTVSSTNGYKAIIMVPEGEISKVKKGSAVKATWEDISINGKITAIAMVMDPNRKAFRVEASFPGLHPRISYGVTADIDIQIFSKPNVFVVERHHLVLENGDKFVWLARDGKAVRVPVTTGLTDQLAYEITSGLQEGDELITAGIKSLTEGAKVRIIEGN
ncbi:MAG: efflux RND transporter periplasmic adaptor subunit [Candidatus Cloacimonadaceae bacterium]|jgi:RND family efflux transporter MFP subunit|nr:efflux RND transporter periplasmic adaptor subunit [Candidatus Cloacimonadota bacterium]MDY0127118.1 efflux RND transporter periplasmic adaptor subunit [Candidatus Cloacimonadaceae bacterium]MCB5254834.1 efflux RND transporter periplasmic adaptor subunit [Candidatus Cloacimonadota bacterium]MCK9178442.1 efflux RND transporter periplasmic adaptor subunit [Candidatus Cloacimonadota bacterium]MCK9243046.1 efflux RND transporter periplasmic adaptor subunit [Candidatus Cloacimonadota bacterium]